MTEQLDAILNGIYTTLNKTATSDIGLAGGRAGIVLFNFAYLKYRGPQENTHEDIFPIQELAERVIDESTNPSFFTGSAGIQWLFSYLYKNDLLAKEDWEFLCTEDSQLEAAALNMLRHGNYDLLYGAIGIAHYFLYSGTYSSRFFFATFFALLNELVDNSGAGEVNLGFAHGISSILQFCLECYKQGVCVPEAKMLARKVIDFLLTNMNVDRSKSYFPNRVIAGKRTDEFSRLAWCYGDIHIAYTLYKAGVSFDDQQLVSVTLEILEHTTGRKAESETQVRDAGVCHGSAGIAHLYNKIWHATGRPVFKAATEHWIDQTVAKARHSPGSTEFEKYDARDGHFENCYGLLEGSAGIGLVLLSYLTGDFSWDYSLMMND